MVLCIYNVHFCFKEFSTYLPLQLFPETKSFCFLLERIMVSFFQVSSGKQVKVSDFARKRVQNEVENFYVARKRQAIEVDTTKEIIVIDDDSDSHISGSMTLQARRHPKVDHNNIGSPSSFKGVVQQPNGHWGAQIYIKLKRIWLGTFPSEEEAAMAYDSAAIKVRSGVDSHRNIPFTNITIHEPRFQSKFTSQVVLEMIQEGSYLPMFYDYLKEQSLAGLKPWTLHKNGEGGFFCKKLFEKVLTPSDVGSLNRLVIPKKFAVMHLHGTVHQPTDSEVVCYDRLNFEWKFRFCYWKSSQSFVFTRGWNAFIKAKKLKAKDTLLFFTCQCPSDETTTTTTTKFGIQVHHYNHQQNNTLEKEDALFHNIENENDLSHMDSNGSRKQGGFRLFGVQINI